MDTRGRQNEAPRAGLPARAANAEGVILWTALVVAGVFAMGQIFSVITVAPVMFNIFRDSSAALPPLLKLAGTLGPLGIIVSLGILDIALFAGFAALARKYWIGMLFVPPMLYMGMAAVLFVLWWPSAAGLLR